MALARIQSVFTFSSSSGGQTYLFDVVVDAQGLVGVRNIRSPLGLIQDPNTQVPQIVVDDMNDAVEAVEVITGETEVDSGVVVFTGQTSNPVVIPGGVLNNTNYRVVYTPPDATLFRTTDKTITGFTAETATTYGTVPDPKTVAYSVLAATAGASTLSGEVTIVFADAGQVDVVFTSALATAAYRVVLSEGDFFDARVLSQSKTGFTIQIAHTLGAADTAVVGYDVFV